MLISAQNYFSIFLPYIQFIGSVFISLLMVAFVISLLFPNSERLDY